MRDSRAGQRLSTLTLMVWPSAVYVRISRAGGGPGVYFDFATLSAHVPIRGSSCAHTILCGNGDNGREWLSEQRIFCTSSVAHPAKGSNSSMCVPHLLLTGICDPQYRMGIRGEDREEVLYSLNHSRRCRHCRHRDGVGTGRPADWDMAA